MARDWDVGLLGKVCGNPRPPWLTQVIFKSGSTVTTYMYVSL